MALHSLYCADVPLRNCSLTHSLTHSKQTASILASIWTFLKYLVITALHHWA